MRILIAAGGTGGHVYPALAAAESIVKQYPDTQLHFVGTVGGFERPLVEGGGVSFVSYDEVQAGPIHGVNPLRMAVSGIKLLIGTFQALRLLGRHKPQAILSTGGWVGLPVALAARLRRIPLMIFLPDVEPGLTIKSLKRIATRVALTVPESAEFFDQGQTIVTGYPLRDAMREVTREQAVAHFGLESQRQTLLVFGGSRGARAINMAFGDILSDLLDDGVQVIHLTGTLDWERSQAQIGHLAEHRHYHGYAYLHKEMALAFAAADLAICRAGASILAEFPFFHLPSILIPLAYSWRYQQINAEYLASRGAAIHLNEDVMQSQLLPQIRELLRDPVRLEEMRHNLAQLARPDGAANVAQALANLAQGDL